MIEIKDIIFTNKSTNEDPTYASSNDSGMDIRAWITETDNPEIVKCDNNSNITYGIELKPLERRLIHTGLYFELPKFCEMQVRSKSGQALKKGLVVCNTPGTVDNNYRGEVCVIALNVSDKTISIMNGEKIAQAVICPVYYESMVTLHKVGDINKNTERGDGGFGHTGTN